MKHSSSIAPLSRRVIITAALPLILLMTALCGPAAAAPVITEVWPEAGISTATLNGVNIIGANFAAGATVTLTRSGQSAITAANVSVVSSTRITCALPISNAASGGWDLTVTNADATTVTLSTAFITVINVPAALEVWRSTGSMSEARSGVPLLRLRNGKVLSTGYSSSDIYDPDAGTWTTTGARNTSLNGSEYVLLNNGKVLSANGQTSGGNNVTTSELYDPASGTWSNTASLSSPHLGGSILLLADGKALTAGGENNSGIVSIAEIYDAATEAWATVASMNTARTVTRAVLLQDGRVLVAGGFGSGRLSSAELYDPITNSWTNTGSMATERLTHTLTLLPDGRVLVAGGSSNSDYLSSAEIYAPSAGTWTATGSMATARYNHKATLLPNGKVLVFGGIGTPGTLKSSEIYDPATGTWSTGPQLTDARSNSAAILLANGSVLVAGGDGLSSSELYTASTIAVRGTITHSAAPLAGAAVTVTGVGISSSAITAADGTYAFSLAYSTAYVITPAMTGYLFLPVSISSYNAAADLTGGDFSSGSDISGAVVTGAAGLAGVTLTITGSTSGSTTTDSSGNYSFHLPSGSYVITPSLNGYAFSPASRRITMTNTPISGLFFTAAGGLGKAAVVEGGPNGYAEPGKGYPAKILLAAPARTGQVTVKIYTLRTGKLVRKLSTAVTAGTAAELAWDCVNSSGDTVGSGIYVAVVEGAGYDNEHIKIGVLK